LMAFPLVPDGNGIFEVLDTDPINGNVAIITLILNVLHLDNLQPHIFVYWVRWVRCVY